MTARNVSPRTSIILFHSTNHTLWAAKILKNEAILSRVIPIPRELSANCGYCLTIDASFAEKTAELLASHGVEYDRIVPQPYSE